MDFFAFQKNKFCFVTQHFTRLGGIYPPCVLLIGPPDLTPAKQRWSELLLESVEFLSLHVAEVCLILFNFIYTNKVNSRVRDHLSLSLVNHFI